MREKTPGHFFRLFLTAIFAFTLACPLFAQDGDDKVSTSLQGLTEATMINGAPALRLFSRQSGTTEVRLVKRDNEDALAFSVYRFPGERSWPRLKPGTLYVTPTRLVFSPDAEQKHFLNIPKTDLTHGSVETLDVYGAFTMIKSQKEKTGFILVWTLKTGTKTEKIPATSFMLRAIQNFDSARAEFNELTASVRPKAETEEEPEDEPIADVADKYDRFRDITTVSTAKMLVRGARRSIRMQAAFTYPGEKYLKPNTIYLTFNISGASAIFGEEDLSLNFLVDKKRVPLGNMKLTEERGKSIVRQALTVSVPYETFLKIADGKNVEFQAGTLEYKLEPVHLEAFRNLNSFKPEN